MMRKTILRGTLLAAAIGCAPLALAATPQQPSTASSSAMHQRAMHKHAMQSHGMGMVAGLELTDAQRAKIRELVQQNIREGRADLQPMRPTRRAFYDATPGSSDFTAATDKLASAAANQASKRVHREAALRTKIYGVLTPAQRTKFAALRKQHEQQMQQQRQQRMKSHAMQAAPATASPPAH